MSIASRGFAATYAPDDRRASKTAGGQTTYYVYDEDGSPSPLIEERMSGGTPTVSMGWGMGADGLRARYSPTTGGPNYMFEYNPQGSLVQRQTGGNTSYSALDTAMYDAYGSKLGDKDVFTGTDEPVRDAVGFQGQFGAYTDNETGLVLMGHRYYSPGTGRFLTRDPKGYGGGINLYGFTGNNPVNGRDPSGLAEDRGGNNDTVRFSLAAFIPVATVSVGGAGFNGNHRGFSAHSGFLDAGNSKLEQNGLINLSNDAVVIDPGQVGRTHGVSDPPGLTHYSGQASNSTMYGSSRRLGLGFGGEYQINLYGDVANPYYKGLPLVPAIRYNITVTFDHLGNVLGVSGSHSAFPAFELYVYSNGHAPKRVYQYNPYAHGRDPLSLFNTVDIDRHTLAPLGK